MAFLQTFNKPKLELINRIHQQRLNEVEENRKRLRPIVETITFLGRQNLAFRGYRDNEPIRHNTNASEVIVNEENFKDRKLEKHLQSSSSNATYKARRHDDDSILFDETTDVSLLSQLSLTLRYVYEGNIREDFVSFVNAFEELA
ncbi:hypothetical protein Zmor_028468 [Zophobas morio]|uniref:DUF4371 domain-containing protein n=1 Tax=Zophobas morio TaxID=2755281 RepID=A0AA38HQE0_9CUCU|nr:hypothetical protein Zmor_028468 [Zophobas morio]